MLTRPPRFLRLLPHVIVLKTFLTALSLLLALHKSVAGGTWAPMASAPPLGVNHAMVLSDGTIFTDNGNGQCLRLTPDIHGNYRNGTWTPFIHHEPERACSSRRY